MTARESFARLYDAFLRKTPRQARSRAVVEAILVATVEQLARGTASEDVPLEQVAARAGVGVGSLYDYFRDRDSLWAAAAAKITEDNREAFERLLARTDAMALRDGAEAIIDFAVGMYGGRGPLPRLVLRIAYARGLMPTLASSQAAFARTLADALRRRTDVTLRDPEATAFVLTSTILGVAHALAWSDPQAPSREAIRATLVDLCVDHLTGERRPPRP